MPVGSATIAYDATPVGSAVLRRHIQDALEKLSLTRREDAWRCLMQSAGRRFPDAPTLIIGDLNRLRAAEGLDLLAASPASMSFVVLVRTLLDTKLFRQPDIALQLRDDAFLVLDLRDCTRANEAACAERLSECFRAVVQRLQPGRVRAARYSFDDGVLWLEFGDGLERAVEWAGLSTLSRLPFTPVSAAVREHGQSVRLVAIDGSEYDIDAGALRSAVDARHRQATRRRHAAERVEVGKRIRGIRERLGLSQEEVAERSGVPQESLSRIENGHRDPRLDTLRRLACALEMDVSALLAEMAND